MDVDKNENETEIVVLNRHRMKIFETVHAVDARIYGYGAFSWQIIDGKRWISFLHPEVNGANKYQIGTGFIPVEPIKGNIYWKWDGNIAEPTLYSIITFLSQSEGKQKQLWRGKIEKGYLLTIE